MMMTAGRRIGHSIGRVWVESRYIDRYVERHVERQSTEISADLSVDIPL